MARIRTIKPEFWKHEVLSELPEPTHMLAAALLNHADDEGYFNANPGLVKAECFPLRESSVSIQDSLSALSNVGFIELGIGADGKRYGRVVKFDEHQRVNRPTPSKIKSIGVSWESSVSTHAQLSEHSPLERKGKEQGKEGKTDPLEKAEPKKKKTRLPTDFGISERVTAWAAEKGFGRLPEHLDAFRAKSQAKAYEYADWDSAFMEAIRTNWAGLSAPVTQLRARKML